jgi:hypothetical protein
MNTRILILALAGFSLFGGTAFFAQGKSSTPQRVVAPAIKHGPVVVELFTSQGCSSCPPADALIGKLSQEPGIIVISRPVTYWDRLGWRDTLAKESNTALQQTYVSHGIGDQVFTPQVVVQGLTSAVGSDERAVRQLITKAAKGTTASVTTQTTDKGSLLVSLDGTSSTTADIKLVTLRRNVPVRIGRGENGGRNIVYTNVLSQEALIGTWRGGSHQLTLAANRIATESGERKAILIQQRSSGPIIGATMLP